MYDDDLELHIANKSIEDCEILQKYINTLSTSCIDKEMELNKAK